MNAEIVTSIIVSAATLLGTMLTVWSGSKLTAYRIEQLEKRVNEYNNTKLRTVSYTHLTLPTKRIV